VSGGRGGRRARAWFARLGAWCKFSFFLTDSRFALVLERKARGCVGGYGMLVDLTFGSYFVGTTWHGGGPNSSDKPRQSATVQYCQPYVRPFQSMPVRVLTKTKQIRQIENQILAVDPRRLGEMPRELVEMLGYRVHKPFIGYGESSSAGIFAICLSAKLASRNGWLISLVDGLNPYRGAMRFLKWAQKPLNRSPPAFPHDDVDSKL
jgi:hypothetical protein